MSTDARMAIILKTSGAVVVELLTWDDEECDIVPLESKALLTYFDKEMPWASTLTWYEYNSYF